VGLAELAAHLAGLSSPALTVQPDLQPLGESFQGGENMAPLHRPRCWRCAQPLLHRAAQQLLEGDAFAGRPGLEASEQRIRQIWAACLRSPEAASPVMQATAQPRSALPREKRGACKRRQADDLQRRWLSQLAWGAEQRRLWQVQLWLGVFPVNWR